MNWIYSCIIAFSMYSRIPMPRVQWKEERMEHVFCFFPLVGAAEGLALGGFLWLGRLFALSPVMTALWGTALPILITGGIHMDGFADTMDAIHSYGDRKKRLEIMKDPHTGAFALICTAVYVCLYAGALGEYIRLAAQRSGGFLWLWPAAFLAMERAFSGLGVLTFPKAKAEGLAASFSQAAKGGTDKRVLIGWILVLEGGAVWAAGPGAGILGLVQLGVFLYFRRMAMREFGGITGDLAGWFLQICELISLCASLFFMRMGIL